MIFDCFINFLEAFTYSSFLAHYLKIWHKKTFIFTGTVLQLILLTIGSFYGDSGLWLSVSVIILMVLLSWIFTKQFHSDYIYIIILYNSFLLLCGAVSIFLSDMLFNLFKSDANLYIYFACILAKIMQIGLTFFFLKFKIDLSTSFDIKHWGFVAALDLVIMCSLVVLTSISVINEVGPNTMNLLFTMVFIIAILYRFTIHKLEIINQRNIENVKLESLVRFNDHKIKLLESMKYEMDQTYHDLFYIIYNMEYYIKSKDYDELQNLVNRYKHMLTKGKLIVDTGNDAFDYFYGLKINDFIMMQIKVENSIFISKREEYEDMTFVMFIINLLEFFKETKEIHVNMSEVGNTLLIKLLYSEGIIEENKLIHYLEQSTELNLSWNIKKHPVLGVRISLDLGNNNEIN